VTSQWRGQTENGPWELVKFTFSRTPIFLSPVGVGGDRVASGRLNKFWGLQKGAWLPRRRKRARSDSPIMFRLICCFDTKMRLLEKNRGHTNPPGVNGQDFRRKRKFRLRGVTSIRGVWGGVVCQRRPKKALRSWLKKQNHHQGSPIESISCAF